MARGLVSTNLIAAVGQAGGLGTLPLGYLSLHEARHAIRTLTALNLDTFAVNLFNPAPNQSAPQSIVTAMRDHVNRFRRAIGLPILTDINAMQEPDLDELITLIIDEQVPVVSFTFGILSCRVIDL